MVEHYLPEIGASYYDFNAQAARINQEMVTRVKAVWTRMMRQSFQTWDIEEIVITSPWQRMFEIDLSLRIHPSGTLE